MTDTKEQKIADAKDKEDIKKDKKRGRWLFWIYFSLIIGSVFLYLFLHSGRLVDIERIRAVEARDNLLASITRAEIVISDAEVDMQIVRTQLDILEKKITEVLDTTKEQTKEQTAEIDKAFKDTNREIKDQTLEEQKKQLKDRLTELGRIEVTKIRGIDEDRARTLINEIKEIKEKIDKDGPDSGLLKKFLKDFKDEITKATKIRGIDEDRAMALINEIEEEIDKDKLDPGVLKKSLKDLKDEITGKIVGGYFWETGSLRWLELFFWAIFGTLFYALTEIQRQVRVRGEFRRRTAGYISMTLRGPFVALLLLFALSTIKLEVVNIGINLEKAPIYVWIFLAGVLGLFSRVAWRQLELIVKSIFPSAWASTHARFRIIPPTANVAFGKTLPFQPDPKQDVRWDIWPDNLGSIDSAGKYTAPKRPGEPPGAVVGAQVTVRAILKEEPSIVETAKVTLYEEKFEVEGDAEVGFTTEHVYRVQPEQEGGVIWSIEPQLGQITEEGKYKAPGEGETPNEPIAKVGTEITIKATRKQEPKESVTKKIKFVEGT